VVICDTGMFLSGTWLPDNTIIFGSIEHGLQRVSAEGGTPTAVTTPDKGQSEIDHHYPKALPGGKAVLFTIHREGNQFGVASYDLQTGTKKILVESAFDPSYVSSGHLLYGTGQALLAVPFDRDRLAITGTPIKLLDKLAAVPLDGLANYGLSPTGTVAFHPDPDRSGRRLVWIDRAGKAKPAAATSRLFDFPRVSPDGQQFAVTVQENDKQDLWIYDSKSDTLVQATFDGASRAPLWTPDGTRLTYASTTDSKERLIWQPTDRSGPAEILLETPHSHWPIGWSSAPRALVYADDPPTSSTELRLLDLNGRRESVPIPEVPLRTVGSNVSPDGQWLAFVLNRTGGSPSINVRPLAGPGLRRQLIECGAAPVWSRDGREMFFLNPCVDGAATAGAAMFALPFDPARGTAAGPPVELFRLRFAQKSSPGPANYDVGPDGRFLAVVPSPDEIEPDRLNVILNVGDDLRRRLPGSR
jgi:dipeptidyl aminopeptidase/acylaminoacyl peptidase